MTNPDWNREEIILALDLYFNLTYGQMDGKNLDVINLSYLLTLMNEPNGFGRSRGSVSLKLANFKRIDPDFKGKGMKRGNKLEEAVWKEFENNRAVLKGLAIKIKNQLLEQLTLRQHENILTDEGTSRTEGGMKVYISSRAERDAKLKKAAIAMHGTSCSVCSFNFGAVYGTWGAGFIEVHHLVPLGGGGYMERKTDPRKDLVVLCANCHRMAHRKKNSVLSIDELKVKLIKPAIKEYGR